MMPPTLDKLAKVLDLERRQGCADRAVIGGLAALLPRWRAEAAGTVPADLVGAVVAELTGYASLPVPERQRRVDALLALLARGGAVTGAPSTSTAGARRASTPPAPRSHAGESAAGGSARTPKPAPPRGSAATSAASHPAPAAGPPDFSVVRTDDDPVLDGPITGLKGVGPKLAELLKRLGLATVRDLLLHLPHRYNDYRQLAPISALRPGQDATVIGTVWDLRKRTTGKGRVVLTVVLADQTGTVGCTFFNQPYLERSFPQGIQVVVSGRPEVFQGRLTFRAPEWEPLDDELVHTGRLVPVYPLTQGLSQRWLRGKAREVATAFAPRLGDPLPPALRAEHGLPSVPEAVYALHVPADEAQLAAARHRLAFDDYLVLGLWSRQRRRERKATPAPNLAAGAGARAELVAALPFDLTGAQRRCLEEIGADLATGELMTRLLQGDVGSGKTAVAAGAIAQCVAAGWQAALMAPTEILADQHLATLSRLLGPLGYRPFDPAGDDEPVAGPRIARLVGSLKASAKATVSAAIGRGEVAVVVGTHALIQEHVAFPRLGLAIVDEQHRFGVLQRAELGLRGQADGLGVAPDLAPHALIMTATPIPRTLAQVVNADLDQSVIDEMPPGRQPVKTRWLSPEQRGRAYDFIRARVARGEQAYIVYPLVEESEAIEARAAVAEHERLTLEVFQDLGVGLLHGRMRPAEKEAVMAAFRAGERQILVATTVIEVGVDVPNATVMLIDGADRFGLAQLHQLRGRVGRGSVESVCLLLADDPSEVATKRLEAMTRTHSGLALAELDLQLRGPGDYFGTLQAGTSGRFRFARLGGEAALGLAQRVAADLMARDPDLAAPEHQPLARRVAAFRAAAERV